MLKGKPVPGEVWAFLKHCKARALSIQEARREATERFKRCPWFGRGISIGYVHKVYDAPTYARPPPAPQSGRPRQLKAEIASGTSHCLHLSLGG